MNIIHSLQSLIDSNGNSDLTESEKRTISAFVKCNEYNNINAKYLEVGIFGGGTIKLLTQHTKTTKFTGIDLFEDFINTNDNTHMSGTYSIENVGQFLHNERVKLIKGNSVDELSKLVSSGEKFDFIFCDGNHSFKATKEDFELSSLLLSDGGQIAFHNCSPHLSPDWEIYIQSDGGPWAVCQEIIKSNKWNLLANIDRLQVFSKKNEQ